jgi:hypothetical protein
VVADARLFKLEGDVVQFHRVLGVQGVRVRPRLKVARRGDSCCVDELGCLGSGWDVGADDTVVVLLAREGVTVNVKFSYR